MRSVDELVRGSCYDGFMRRVLFTLLVALAIVAGGFASASAALACPMQQAAHACCPDEGVPDERGPANQHEMDGCLNGSPCRTNVTQPPPPQQVRAPATAIDAASPTLVRGAPSQGLLQECWRPPRTLAL
ncbi:MAG: hypothetical protein BroJett013_25430 [Alphaproteobacteria bacterium]|nr:MAG: hypothetical protein BroJett013_25430 [Alphaproteobacteria bacterium]